MSELKMLNVIVVYNEIDEEHVKTNRLYDDGENFTMTNVIVVPMDHEVIWYWRDFTSWLDWLGWKLFKLGCRRRTPEAFEHIEK